jgi:hypothetical protein
MVYCTEERMNKKTGKWETVRVLTFLSHDEANKFVSYHRAAFGNTLECRLVLSARKPGDRPNER